MKISPSLIKQVLPVLALVSLCSCEVRSPLYLAPGFSPAEVNQVSVLQPVDLREKAAAKRNLNDLITKKANLVLGEKGYNSTPGGSLPESAVRTQLAKPTPAWIASLPTSERWALLLVLKNSKSGVGLLSSEGNAEVDAILFDKQKSIVAWREQGTGTAASGTSDFGGFGVTLLTGAVDMAMVGKKEKDAVHYATLDAMSTLPRVPGTKPKHLINRMAMKEPGQ